MKTRTIEIPPERAPAGHGGPVLRIVLREPKYAEFMDLGEPYVDSFSMGGTVTRTEDTALLGRYIERCIEEPKDPAILQQLTLTDARRVKDAMAGFFTQASEKTSTGPSTG